MFIMTGLNVHDNMVRVYDSKDNTNEFVNLSNVVQRIFEGKTQIAGISMISSRTDSQYLPAYGIYVSFIEARETMANLYIQAGVAPTDAYRRVGLAR